MVVNAFIISLASTSVDVVLNPPLIGMFWKRGGIATDLSIFKFDGMKIF